MIEVVVGACVVLISIIVVVLRNSGGVSPKQTGYDVVLMRALMQYEEDASLHRDYIAPFMLSFYTRFMLKFAYWRKRMTTQHSPGLYPIIACRTIWLDDSLRSSIVQNNIQQVVILGAAMDSRAIRFEKEIKQNKITVYELDLPAFIDAKTSQISKVHPLNHIPPHLHLKPIDFEKQSLEDVLFSDKTYNKTKKTAFLWEGVTMYLSMNAIHDVFSFVQKHPSGSCISFDFILDEMLKNPDKFYGGRETYEATKGVSEKYKSGFSVDELSHIAQQHGMRVKGNILAGDEVKQVIPLYSTNKKWAKQHRPFDFVGLATFEVL